MKNRQTMKWMCGLTCGLVTLATATWALTGASSAQDASPDQNAVAAQAAGESRFTKTFFLEDCTFSSTGRNRFLRLQPGFRLVLEGQDEGELVHLVITVLNETKTVSVPGLGKVETRIVEERETVGDELFEVSRNYFAMCNETNSFFYFGEFATFFDGRQNKHEGSWEAGVNGAKPGLQMPGITLLGSRYFQEVAPPVALDRAEIVSLTEVVNTPAGEFKGCLKTEETTPLEPGLKEFKSYAPGIGLIKDGPVKLKKYGFVQE